jgi:hypothetical protein
MRGAYYTGDLNRRKKATNNECSTCIEGRLSHCLSFCSSFGEPVYVSFLNQCMNLIMDISQIDRRQKVDKEENDVALNLRDKRFDDVITRTAHKLKGQLKSQGEYHSVAERVLNELKAFGGTVLLQVGSSSTEGYIPSSDDEATKSGSK